MDILSSAQSAPAGSVKPVLGSTCLAMDEDCWYRAEKVKLSIDETNATLFLLDYGKTVCVPVSSLRPLPSSLSSLPGLVCLVKLRGVKRSGEDWSQDEISGAMLVLDVGGWVVKDVEVYELQTVVSMKDMEGNDVADLLVETGIAEKAKIQTVGEELKFIPGTLIAGGQQAVPCRSTSAPRLSSSISQRPLCPWWRKLLLRLTLSSRSRKGT